MLQEASNGFKVGPLAKRMFAPSMSMTKSRCFSWGSTFLAATTLGVCEP